MEDFEDPGEDSSGCKVHLLLRKAKVSFGGGRESWCSLPCLAVRCLLQGFAVSGADEPERRFFF